MVRQAIHLGLDRRHKLALAALFLVALAFAALVEKRSAFMQRRMTDAGVYFRAAWAVRSGDDLYAVEDDNNWHYNYPPLLAILMLPLADAPAGVARDGMLPYPVSVAIWLALNLLSAAVAVHWLARGIEENSDDPAVRGTPRGSRAWWGRRMLPALFCLPPIAHTLMRGQVNLLVLVILAGMLRSLAGRRSGQAGLWLAGAICIKIIPAFLLVFPLWRRDWRFLGGCAAGLVLGLGAVPLAAMGPERTLFCYKQLAAGVLLPGLTHEGDPTRAKELTDMNGTGSQSFIVVGHNLLNPDRNLRPAHAEPALRLAALGLAALMGLLTLGLARRRWLTAASVSDMYVSWGALVLVMLFASPVSHMHYYALAVPLVMGLHERWQATGWGFGGWLALGACFYGAQLLPHIPAIDQLRDFGLPLSMGLALWTFAMVALARRAPAAVQSWNALRRAA
jgi:alpha-1,2-mannosyltransferase